MLLDLWKSNDRVNPQKLLKKLNDYVVPSNFIKILWQIYNNYRMKIDGAKWIKTDTGLPQGSCLSPILFSIDIEDLIKDLDNNGAFFRAYANNIMKGIKTENKQTTS